MLITFLYMLLTVCSCTVVLACIVKCLFYKYSYINHAHCVMSMFYLAPVLFILVKLVYD